jgi:uncharacterized protein (DUF433 family)
VQLEDYFDFLSPLDIRVKGTRVGIETILGDYLKWGLSPEAIADRYRSLTLEQVYATLTYYWHDPTRGDDYLRRLDEELTRQRTEQERNPSPGIQRLRALVRARDDAKRRVSAAT